MNTALRHILIGAGSMLAFIAWLLMMVALGVWLSGCAPIPAQYGCTGPGGGPFMGINCHAYRQPAYPR